jgi:hypothetical protein
LTGKVVGIEINVENAKYMLVTLHQTGAQEHVIKTANISFENVSVQILGNDSNKSKFHSGEN